MSEKSLSLKIGYQGVEGANSHISCKKFYPKLESVAYNSFSDLFVAVANEEIDYAMMPLENSYAGRVSEIHNLLSRYNAFIVAEHFLPISHNLVAIKGAKIEDISTVISHPQALMQCSEFLRSINVKLEESSNTAKAAQEVSQMMDKAKAAICSQPAAQLYDLEVLKTNIQDARQDNVTIFVTIAKKSIDPNPALRPVITSLIFTIRNIPGALYKSLGGFATNGVSILKLESYIPGGNSRQAQFFIALQGHPNQPHIALSLEELGFFSKNVKLIGIYYADPARSF